MARRAPISTLRNTASLRRAPGKKPPRSITLIVCEGETEQLYLDAVRQKFELTTAEVVLPANNIGPAPISVVDCAINKANEKGGYDHIFCVFDRDGHESYARARQKIKAHATRKRARVAEPRFEVVEIEKPVPGRPAPKARQAIQ